MVTQLDPRAFIQTRSATPLEIAAKILDTVLDLALDSTTELLIDGGIEEKTRQVVGEVLQEAGFVVRFQADSLYLYCDKYTGDNLKALVDNYLLLLAKKLCEVSGRNGIQRRVDIFIPPIVQRSVEENYINSGLWQSVQFRGNPQMGYFVLLLPKYVAVA